MGIRDLYKYVALAMVIGSSVGSTAFGAQGQPNWQEVAKVAGVAVLGVGAAAAALKVATSPTTAFCVAWAPIILVGAFAVNALGRELYEFAKPASGENRANQRFHQFFRVGASLIVGYCLVDYLSPSIARYCRFAGNSMEVGSWLVKGAVPVYDKIVI